MLSKTERHDFHNAIAAGFWITGKPGAWHAGFGRGSDSAVFPTSHATKDAARREALAVFLAPRTYDSGDVDDTTPRAGFEVEIDAGEGCTRSSFLDFLDANPDLDRETIAALEALAPGETYHAGGGAACAWSVRRIG